VKVRILLDRYFRLNASHVERVKAAGNMLGVHAREGKSAHVLAIANEINTMIESCLMAPINRRSPDGAAGPC
jgi:hypothetical protein